ncbi:MAG: hypothetical protein E6K59_07050 [Nitrospirae bacterium]|nr:MAG: hypothetical protein E6K59_07050 [Nitrospirota bacterium]
MAGHAYIPYWLRVVFVAGVLLPSAAPAQLILIPPTVAPAQTGYYLTPALSVTEVYDDNVFYTPSPRTQDFLTRIRPGLKAGYQSAPLTVEGGYAFDSEIYSRHSELTDAQVRQQGSIELKATPIQVLTLSLPVSYFQTRTPTELNLQTGLAVGRVRAERYTANPAFTYRYDPLTTAKGDYTYAKDLLAGGITIDSHILNLALDIRLSLRDTVGPGYVGRRFEFSGFPSLTSHAFTLGWSHELTPLTTFTLRGGPRLTEGTVDRLPEASAAIRHKLKSGQLSLSYASTLATVFGLATAATAQGITATAAMELLPKLQLSAAPALYTVSEPLKATVYVMNLEVSYQLTKTLAWGAAYQFSLQQGTLSGSRDVDILHNIFLIRLTVTYPVRVD